MWTSTLIARIILVPFFLVLLQTCIHSYNGDEDEDDDDVRSSWWGKT